MSHSSDTSVRANALASESSPYLLAHAHDPVEWHGWNGETLERARHEGKPIHLSIGYNACHWCWVLHRESFSDPATAALLNENFINIKVDREERPDLDRIYQLAHQLLTRRPGGWPLTMFLTHDDRRPFFGGTYFPKEPRHGLPAFRELLERVAEYYRTHQDELRRQNDELIRVAADLNPPPVAPETPLDASPIRAAREHLGRTFDQRFGGFGNAPKFPHANQIERLLRDWRATSGEIEPDLHALYMATLTLRRMGEGGLCDQLGGGFFRYSVDPYWMIPHFEKMTSDNALLLPAYAQAAVATGDTFYARIAAETADWALREMRSPEGGFCTSFDADSDGHEGRFYVWDRDEVRGLLPSNEYAPFAARFGLDREPNFEGRWHLHGFESLESIAENLDETAETIETRIGSARHSLLAARNARAWPARDDKVLTSWNALMIRGLAIAARSLERPDLAAEATRTLDLIRATLWRNGRLLAALKGDRAYLDAYLDDYIFLADAILELQQVRFRASELAFATALLDVVLERFQDDAAGGFFFTAADHEALILRSKSFSDEATPAGNGVAACVLQRMGHLLGEPRYLQAAERTIRAAWHAMEKFPHAHVTLLTALEELLDPPQIVIVRGESTETSEWARALAKTYAPRRLVLAIPADASGLPAGIADRQALDRTVAYICRGSVCSSPVTSLAELLSTAGV